ncbi:MAG: AraC family transcriptional regulator [Xenococcus sp. MO_188.B8]|nr:AraC family transcriptional regulator [Xenococcus sp. MO_188.B8]
MKNVKGAFEFLNFKTTNPEEFQSIISQELTPIEQVEPMGKDFHADFKAYTFGQLFFTRVQFPDGISLIPIPGEKWLFLELPLSGQLQLRYRGRDISFDQNSTYSIVSNEPILYRYQENAKHTTVGIDKQMLTACAQKLVNGQEEREFTFHPQLFGETSETASFRRYLEFISQELVRGKSLFSYPLIATEIQNTICSMVLTLFDNNYLSLETKLEEACLPAYVMRARDYIENHLGDPVSLADVTAAAGVHVNTLLKGFKQHYEISPIAYLKRKRLELAHRILLAADPLTTSVATSATEVGFFHFGRFAHDYYQFFGELPSETLKR